MANTPQRKSWTTQKLFCLVIAAILPGFGATSSHYSYENVNVNIPLQSPAPVQEVATRQDHELQTAMEAPDMKSEHIAMSLELTSEINSRLDEGSQLDDPAVLMTPQSHQIPFSHQRQRQKTIFHATSSEDEQWGSNLRGFTQQLLKMFDLPKESNDLILSLSFIYLDRATSVETPRSNAVPPCPFCSSQTMRRLLLSSTLTAASVVLGTPAALSDEQLAELGVSSTEIAEMMVWMEAAMGDVGLFVSAQEMQSFKALWERAFLDNLPGSAIVAEDQHHQNLDPRLVDSASKRQTPGFYERREQSGTTQTLDAGNEAQQSSNERTVQAHRGFRPLPAFTSSKVAAA